jgi:hypothetical protein
MSCLDATFTLTPRSPYYYDTAFGRALLYCWGADFDVFSPMDLSSLYASNRFYFNEWFASDPNPDYTQWANIKKARFLASFFDFQAYAAGHNKQLALIFGFDALSEFLPSRVLIYSNAGLLQDQQLVYGDNQFLLEIESLDLPLNIYFIHAGSA